MKKIIVIFTIIIGFQHYTKASTDVTPYLDSARIAYTNNDFENSVRLYMRVLEHGYESPQLYYNLGNGNYKQMKIAQAILWYQRALKLDPSYQDAKINLQHAKEMIVDKIDPISPPYLTRWLNSVVFWLTPNGWAILSMIMYLLLAAGLFLLFSSADYNWRRFSLPIIIFAFIFSLLTTFISKKSYNYATEKTTAVVMSPSVTVLSTPHSEGTKLFTIHEGLTVYINSSVDDWYEIRLDDGRVGWLRETDIEPV